MAASLLSLLTQLTGQTPDQIVTRLKGKGWIKGCDMPSDLWNSWRDGRKRVAICHVSDYTHTFSFDGDRYGARGWTTREVNHNLSQYYFMLADEYEANVTLNPEGQPF